MDTGLTVEPISIVVPISIVAQSGLAQPEPIAVRQDLATRLDVATEIALWQSVMASAAVDPIDNIDNIDNAVALAPLSEPTTISDTIIDPATQTFMFRVVDVQTGSVVSEVPAGAPLVAYSQAVARLIASGSTPAEAQAIAAIDIRA